MFKPILHIITLFSLFAIFYSCKKDVIVFKTSEIDTLNSAKEVQSLIRKLDSTLIKYEVKKIQDFKRQDFEFQEIIKLSNELKITESFYKTDFDNNGYTDLLVIGDDYSCYGNEHESCSYKPIVVLNFGNEKYKVVNLSQNYNDYFVPKIQKSNEKRLLVIYKPNIKDWIKKIVSKNPKKQVLEYKFGDFIEFNSNDKNYIPISEIEFSTDVCFGTCPMFQITIDKNQNAVFIAEHFNFSQDMENWSEKIEGRFHTKIKNKDYQQLTKTLEYIDFPNLENNYSVDWTDDQTVKLKITYGNGKVKTIEDYGASGTYGLKKVYKILFDLRKNQDWIKE